MIISEAVRTSFEEIRAHKGRSALTLVGVFLGTIALVVVLSLLEGVRASVLQGFDDLGYDGVLIAEPKRPSSPVERAKAHMSRGMRSEDEKHFQNAEYLQGVAPVGETQSVISVDNNVRRVKVFGVTPMYAVAKNRDAEIGRFISQYDYQSVSAVCVLGHTLKKQLFGEQDAIGRQLTLGGKRMTVIGVVRKFNMEMVNDRRMREEMKSIYIPLSLYKTMYGRADAVQYMLIKSADFDRAVEAEDESKSILKRAHNGIQDVEVENVGKEILEERQKVDTILKNWLIVLFSIAGVSLVIGGVGIFSVLKISISERLYEIGLRKSMGATDGEILFQFLVESVTLSALGAGLGGLLGVGLVTLLSSKFPAGLPISGLGVAAAASFAVFIGLFAGLYPSLSASRLEPVEALRA